MNHKKLFYRIVFKVWIINAIVGAGIGFYYNGAGGAVAGLLAGGTAFAIILWLCGILAGSAGINPDDLYGGDNE